MRTTIDLPEVLRHRMETLAAQQGSTLDKLIIRYLERCLGEATEAPPGSGPRHRSPLPVVRASTCQPLPDLGAADLEAILDGEDPTEG